MKKRGRGGQTGNPARKRRGEPAPQPKPWRRWLGREMEAFFNLPWYIGEILLFAVFAIAVLAWRWISA